MFFLLPIPPRSSHLSIPSTIICFVSLLSPLSLQNKQETKTKIPDRNKDNFLSFCFHEEYFYLWSAFVLDTQVAIPFHHASVSYIVGTTSSCNNKLFAV